MIPNEPVQQGNLLSRAWSFWFTRVDKSTSYFRGVFTSADRPARQLEAGVWYFDTTLGIPVFYDGAGWIDAMGNSV